MDNEKNTGIPMDFEAEMRAKIEAEMRAKIEAEMRTKIEAEMRAEIQGDSKAKDDLVGYISVDYSAGEDLLAAVKRESDSGSWKRGNLLTKFVDNIEQNGENYSATVYGTKDYKVDICVRDGIRKTYCKCSCPNFYINKKICKHIVATCKVICSNESEEIKINSTNEAMVPEREPVKTEPITLNEDNQKLLKQVDLWIQKLEKLFPEHKVFAFNSLDKDLQERFARNYKSLGYASVESMLHAYGFEIITGAAVRELRNSVIYVPGNEPEIIKNKIDNMIVRLEEYYPERVISSGLQKEHKSLSKTVSGLYQWLGYESAGEFLKAYGYEYNVSTEGGRPAGDYQAVIDALIEKYKDGPKPNNMGELLFENPDLQGRIKTLQNKSQELFGMSMRDYFVTVGIMEARGTVRKKSTIKSSSSIKEEVISALNELYKLSDKCSDVEKAINNLSGMKVKQNKAGEIYILSASECSDIVKIPYGINSIHAGAFNGKSNIRSVVIEAELTGIEPNTFADCTALESITLPEGLVTINRGAFKNCSSLGTITIPESVKYIEENAFAGCSSLEKVIIEGVNVLISDDVFADCPFEYVHENKEETDCAYFRYSINSKNGVVIDEYTGTDETVVIPGIIEGKAVTDINKGAFENNKYVVDVSMSDYISTINNNAFKDCISLRKVHLSNGISKLSAGTFSGCSRLEEVNIPDNVIELKNGTFKDSSLKKLHIGKRLAEINNKAFNKGESNGTVRKKVHCKVSVDKANPYIKTDGSAVFSRDGKILFGLLSECSVYNIPEGVEIIGESAFQGIESLSDVSFPDSLCTISKNAFADTALRSVVFGPSVKSIEDRAFRGCVKLTAAIFNEGVEYIGDEAFEYCPIISVILPKTLKRLGQDSFSILSEGYYMYGSGKNHEFKIKEGNPYYIAKNNALYSISGTCKTLQVVYGRRLNSYDYGNSSDRIDFTVDKDTSMIGAYAFKNCYTIKKVNLPEGIKTIGDFAFENCLHLDTINIPDSVESIGACAFLNTAIKKIRLGLNIKEIGSAALITGDRWSHSTLKDIEVDKNNKFYSIKDKMLLKLHDDMSADIVLYFGNDENVVVPENITEICTKAFNNSTVSEIHIPSSVTDIAEDAFTGCNKLSRLVVGFAKPENGFYNAVIYIPEAKNDASIREQFIDCIRVNGNGNLFDFVKYDSLFKTIKSAKDKILVATDRLKSAIQLVPLYRDTYLSYLRKNAKKAIEVVVEFDDLDGLNLLTEVGVFTGKNIDSIIEIANRSNKPEILAHLLEYKNNYYGNDDIFDDFKL